MTVADPPRKQREPGYTPKAVFFAQGVGGIIDDRLTHLALDRALADGRDTATLDDIRAVLADAFADVLAEVQVEIDARLSTSAATEVDAAGVTRGGR